MADRIYDSGFKAKALDHVKKAHGNLNNPSVEDDLTYYTYCNTIYVKDFKDYDRSIAMGDSMLQLLAREGLMEKMPVRRIQAYNIEANALMAKGLYRDAYNNFFKAKQLASSNGDSCSLSEYSYSLGMVLFRQQKYEEAANYFKQSYAEAMLCVDDFTYFYHKQELLDNIGLCYSRAHRYDSAMAYYNAAIGYITSNTGKYPNKDKSVYEAARAVVLGNMADIYLAMKKNDVADSLLRLSINVNLQKGYANSDAELSQLKLAGIYLSAGSLDSMHQLLSKVYTELDTIPDKNVELQWDKLMWQYHAARHDSVKAFRYMLAFNTSSDSMQKANKSLMDANIDASIDNTEHQYKIYMLQTEQFQQRVYLIIAILVAAMATVIVVMMFRYSSKADKNVKALTELNNKINDAKEKLEIAFNELESKNKDNSRILRSVAHDVMSPIAAIAALTDILISESQNDTDEHKEIFELIKEACNNSLSLSKDILEAAATLAPGTLTKEWVNINKLVAGSAELLGFRATEKKQHLVIDMPQAEITAYVNREKIWRVINNLITNAIKFSYEGSDILITLSADDKNVLFVVKDSGIGIPEKHKKNLFDMFTESKMRGTAGEKPNGLGLSISLQIARSHGGNIWFESEENKGATFYFSFPKNNDLN